MKHKLSTAAWLTPAAAFLLSAGLWTAAIALFGFYPFGVHSILITDMGQQYTEYHLALYDIVHNGSSLIYTWDTGMGMNFLGIYAYYLASPFTWIILFFQRAAIPDALLLIISLKIAFAGLTFSIFLRKAENVRGIVNVMFSALYALSAYTVVFFFDIMWLDAVVLLPLVVLAVLHVIQTHKIIPFIIVLFILFITNFYTAYMVGLFCFLLLIALLWVQAHPFRESIRIIGLFLGAAAIAACLSVFLMLPTFFALQDCQGSSATPLFLGFTSDPLTLLSKFTFGAYDSMTDSGTANIYCGILSLGLLPVWFLHDKFSKRVKIASGILIGFIFLCMLYNPLDVFWHACETPVWFPCRYSFVLIFTIVTCAAMALSRPDGLTFRKALGGFLFATLAVIAVKIPEWLYPTKFHTMKGNLWVTLGALGVYLLLILIFVLRKRRWLRGIGLGLLAICVSVELVENATNSFTRVNKELRFDSRDSISTYLTRSSDLMTAFDNYTAFAGNALSAANFYRVENSNAYNPNDGLTGDYPSISHYSSFSRQGTFSFLKNCGMFCTSGNKLFRYYGSTSPLDAILGVRYVFSKDDYRLGYLPTGVQSDGLNLYENQYFLPLAFFADSAVQSLPTSEQTPFLMLNKFFSSFNGLTYVYYKPLITKVTCDNGILKSSNNRTVVSTQGTATLHITITNPKEQDVLFYLYNNFTETTKIYVNGQLLNTQSERYIRGVVDIGDQPEGTIDISLATTNNHWFSGLQAMNFDEPAFQNLMNSLHQYQSRDLTVTTNSLGEPLVSGNVTAPRDGTLFTSIPADTGWTATIDGKKVETVSAGGAFLTIPITKGEHTFLLHYRPRGLIIGCIVSACTALLCILWCVLHHIRRKRKLKTSEDNS